MEAFRGWLAQQRVSGVRSLRGTSSETYTAMFSAWFAHLEALQVTVVQAGAPEARSFFEQKAMEPVSRRRYLQLLDRVYQHMRDCGRRGDSPMQQELLKERVLEREAPAALTPEQLASLNAHLQTLPGWKGSRDRALAALLLGAGLRANEVTWQKVSDLTDDFFVHIHPKSVHRPHTSLVLPDGPYRGWLTTWLAERRDLGIPGELIAPSTLNGKAFEASGQFRRTKAWLEAANIAAEQQGPNLLRGTFARSALSCGRYTLEQVQEFLGHEDSRSTERLLVEAQ